jgi:hypothetical protein
MFPTFKTIPILPKRWLPSWRLRPFYQQETYGDSLETQEPSETKNNDITVTTVTTNEPQHSGSKPSFVRGVSRSSVRRFLGPRFQGWRFGALNFAVWSSVVFLVNLSLAIWATTKEKNIFFEGNCDTVKRLNTGLHLLINVFSTVLLAGSNYCMQCMSAPTRSDIDHAHRLKPKSFLDIGVPSMRNLTKISRRRVVLWCLLGLSSLPLHLL